MDFKGSQFEREIILWGVRWYVAYPISYRQLEEMMGERGVAIPRSIAGSSNMPRRLKNSSILRGNGPTSIALFCDPFPRNGRNTKDEGRRLKRSLITWTL